jgi:asparagine synthase (glutamine-hydrolysing)
MSPFSGHWSFDELPAHTLVVFGGRLDNRSDLIGACGGHQGVSWRSTDAELALCAYDVFGIDVAAKLRGDFAIALFDPRERRMLLACDAIGVKPLYYQRRAHSILFASDIKGILARPGVEAKPHDRLLAELMVGQLHRQDADGTTLFEGISAVPPAHVAIFSPSTSVVCRYWDFTGTATGGTSAAEYAEGFRFHFERAVARRVRGDRPTAVAVSGGVDSSAILCVANVFAPSAYPPVGLTYTHRDGSDADESQYIGDVERFCGREIRRLDPHAADHWMEDAEQLIRRTEAPMITRDSHLNDQLLAAARDAGAGAILTGHWGDQMLFEQAYLIDLLHRGAWRTMASHLREYPEWFPGEDSGYFRRRLLLDFLQYDVPQRFLRPMRMIRRAWKRPPPWRDWYTPSFLAQIGRDEFARDLAGDAATTMARAIYREVRSRYHGLCLEWHAKMAAAYGLDAGFPFFDRDLIEFLMGVPGEILTRGGVPKALLRDSLAGLVPDGILARRTKGDFTRFANEASRKDHARMVEWLGQDPLVVQAGYVDADKLKRGLQSAGRALEGSASNTASRSLTAVVALEMWLRQFFGNARSGQETQAWTNQRSPTASRASSSTAT